jgi:multicomponent Na+:H+ antiporter subunit G
VTVRVVLTNVFLWLGVGLVLMSCLGVLVMRDVYSRLHFSSPAVLGALCIAVAVIIKDSFSLIGDNTIAIAVFVLVTSPLLTHATARAARIARHGEWGLRPEDDVEIEEP